MPLAPDTKEPEVPFAGLRRIATVEAALQPLVDAVDAYWQNGTKGDRRALIDTTLDACHVMTQASLFSSNCTRMFNRLELMPPQDAPPGRVGMGRAHLKNVIRKSWVTVATAVRHEPELLAYRDVCNVLRAALGTRSQHLLPSVDLKCYGLILDCIDGATRVQAPVSTYTRRLGAHLRDWAFHVAGQQLPHDNLVLPQRTEPLGLGHLADQLGRRLVQKTAHLPESAL